MPVEVVSTNLVGSANSRSSGGSVQRLASSFQSSGGASYSSSSYQASSTISSGGTLVNGTHRDYIPYGNIEKVRADDTKGLIELNNRLAKYIDSVRSDDLSVEELQSIISKDVEIVRIDIQEELNGEAKRIINEQEAKIRALGDEYIRLQKIFEHQESTITQISSSMHQYEHNMKNLLREIGLLLEEIAKLEGLIVHFEFQLRIARQRYDLLVKESKVKVTGLVHGVLETYQSDHNLLVEELLLIRSNFSARLAAYEVELTKKIHLELQRGDALQLDDFWKVKKEWIALSVEIEKLKRKIAKYDAKSSTLHWQITEFGHLEGYLKGIHVVGMSREEILVLIEEKLRSYKYLEDENIKLISELETYRRLLNEGEQWVHVTPHQDYLGRYYKSESHIEKLGITIDEVNMNGNYIQLTNNGKEDVSLDKWRLSSKAGQVSFSHGKYTFTTSPTVFLLPPKVIRPKQSIKFWSPKSGASKSVDDVVMKESWPSDKLIFVELFDNLDKRQAFKVAFFDNDRDRYMKRD